MNGNFGAAMALVCLDLQRAQIVDPQARRDSEPALAACRRVLAQARVRRWPVLHVHRRELSPDGGRPIPGLEPLPCEPVFIRPGPSAFSNIAFRDAAQAMGGPFALIGFSLAEGVLATVFAAVDRGLQVEMVCDAVVVGAEPDLQRVMRTPLASLAPLARALKSSELFQEDAATLVAANAP